MTMRMRSILILTLILVPLADARAGTWTVAEGSEVVFTSRAPMESFDGRTDRITGELACTPGETGEDVTLRMTVDLASLDTGIGLRNRHMRENHLETDRYPEAVFTGGTVVGGDLRDLRPGASARLEVKGLFELHGVSRELVVPADVTMAADGSLRVDAAFTVKLSDHDIERPRFLVMKLADEQAVTVRLQLDRKEAP